MSTSALRALILAAAVVIGGMMLVKAFPHGAVQAFTPPSASPAATPSPTPSHSPTPSGPSTSPTIKGVTIQILNATQTPGLAATWAAKLKKAGYKVCATCVGNAAVAYAQTTIYYAPGAKADALAMRAGFFPKAKIAPNPPSIQAKVKLSLFVGADLVATPSPTASG